MKIMAFECSASPASIAVMEDGKILAENFMNVRITHSETLLPMAGQLLDNLSLTFNDMDGYAVSAGPGSFTGVRIGIAAVKGLAFSGKKAVGVSTLEAMSLCGSDFNGIVCSLMDARCSQVYNGLFRVKSGKAERLCDDRALMMSELKADLLKYENEKILLVGDGAELYYKYANDENLVLAAENVRYQRASAVALLAYESFVNDDVQNAEDILPIYLRLPQAERELKKRLEKNIDKE